MTVGTVADGVLAGLGLFLLGAWLAQAGLSRSAGSWVRLRVLRNTTSRAGAWRLGALIGLGMPVSEESSRTAAGLVNTGLLAPRLALWVAVGHGVAACAFAWLYALLHFELAGNAVGLALIAGGAAALWISPEHARGAVGRAIAGWGLMLLGMVLLGQGFENGRGTLELDTFSTAAPVRPLLFGALGLGLAVALRSGAAAVVLVCAAAASGAMTTSSALAFSLGAGFGAAAGVALSFKTLTSPARRSAVALIGAHGLALVTGTILCLCALPILSDPPAFLSDPTRVVAIVLTLSLAGPALVLRALELVVEAWLGERFLVRENDETAPRHVDRSLAAVPELALPALALEAHRQHQIARRLAVAVVSRQPVSERRENDDRRIARSLSHVVDGAVSSLAQGSCSAGTASTLPGLARASRATYELGEQCGFLAETRLAWPGALGAELEARMLRLQLEVARLVEAADPADEDFDVEALEAGMQSIEAEVRNLRRLSVERCAEGQIGAVDLERAIERLNTVRRVAQLALDAALDLDPALWGEGATGSVPEDVGEDEDEGTWDEEELADEVLEPVASGRG